MHCTSAMRFVDTNVAIYALGHGAAEAAKSQTAQNLLQADDLAVSVQVLQEFYVQVTRSTRGDPLSHEEAVAFIEALSEFPVQEITLDLVRAALRTKERFRISYWDAAIVEAARALGCDTVLTEDLNDGQNFEGVRVVNPFVRGS
jgi:predicted nucleic acid-binding protein